MASDGNDLISLREKKVLITGVTHGTGQAISLRVAQAGATVIASCLNEQAAEHLKATAKEERLAIMLSRARLISGQDQSCKRDT